MVKLEIKSWPDVDLKRNYCVLGGSYPTGNLLIQHSSPLLFLILIWAQTVLKMWLLWF